MADIIDRTFHLLQDLFRQASVSYVIIGGFAVGVWGVERATLDIDVMVGGRRQQFERLVALANTAGLQAQPQFLEENPFLSGLMMRFRVENLHVDLLRPRDAHDRNVLRRRRQVVFAGRHLWFPAPEDLILMKLKVGRDRDFDDAIRIAERNRHGLNHRYLFRWAQNLGVTEELTYILKEP